MEIFSSEDLERVTLCLGFTGNAVPAFPHAAPKGLPSEAEMVLKAAVSRVESELARLAGGWDNPNRPSPLEAVLRAELARIVPAGY
jgi:hypothetical protein